MTTNRYYKLNEYAIAFLKSEFNGCINWQSLLKHASYAKTMKLISEYVLFVGIARFCF